VLAFVIRRRLQSGVISAGHLRLRLDRAVAAY
jgi:hypothetical protein